MEFEYLDSESEKMLKDFIDYKEIPSKEFSDRVIENLIKSGYLKGLDVSTLSSPYSSYIVIDVTQKGKSYFELKRLYEKEKKKITRRELWIATISTLVGTVVGVLIDNLIRIFIG